MKNNNRDKMAQQAPINKEREKLFVPNNNTKEECKHGWLKRACLMCRHASLAEEKKCLKCLHYNQPYYKDLYYCECACHNKGASSPSYSWEEETFKGFIKTYLSGEGKEEETQAEIIASEVELLLKATREEGYRLGFKEGKKHN